MYTETDFLLALIKDEDWLGDTAGTGRLRTTPVLSSNPSESK